MLDDPVASAESRAGERLVFCTGKIYYDLVDGERPATSRVIRVEELAPWPRDLSKIVDQYPNVEEVVWAQEEPKNMGAWTYVQPRLRASIGTLPMLRYIGRPERASPAEGHKRDHDVEQARIVADVLTPAPSRKKPQPGDRHTEERGTTGRARRRFRRNLVRVMTVQVVTLLLLWLLQRHYLDLTACIR